MNTTLQNKKPVYRMSSVGKCSRALSAERQSYPSEPAPDWLETAAEEGKWHEQRIKYELEADDIAVTREQEEVVLEHLAFKLVGHIDGIIYDHSDQPKLLEIKSMSQYEFDRWMRDQFVAFPQYEAQLACYLVATQLSEALYIVKNRSSGYEDRRTYYLSSLVPTYSAIVDKLTNIEDFLARWIEAGARDGVYPLVDFDPGSLECRRCEFKHLCVPQQEELTPLAEAILTKAVIDYRAGMKLDKQAKELLASSRVLLESHTRATGIDRWKFAGLVINLVRVKETINYPKANLLKVFTLGELAPVAEIREAYDFLRITDLEKEDG